MTKEKAADLFKHYPTVNVFHFTADGQAFAEKQHADAHAAFLDKKEPVIVSVSRDEAPPNLPLVSGKEQEAAIDVETAAPKPTAKKKAGK